MLYSSQYKTNSQLNTNLMKYQQKQATLNPPESSTNSSRLKQLISRICPCMFGSTDYTNHEQQTKSNINTRKQMKSNSMADVKKEDQITFQTLVNQGKRKQNQGLKMLYVGSNDQNYDFNRDIPQGKKITYPVNSYEQDKLMLLGQPKRYLLCKIKKISLKAPQNNNPYRKQGGVSKPGPTGHTNMDKYWPKRYSLFSKFDEGISINESAWPLVLSEVVSEYIASQVQCQRVANLAAGVGAEAIKLANTCGRVFVTVQLEGNLNCLYVNSRVYGSQNIQIIPNLPSVLKSQPQIFVISPFIPLSQPNPNPVPYLQSLLPKLVATSHNLLVIVPPCTPLLPLVSLLSYQLSSPNLLPEMCCLRIEKIYNGDEQLQCIVLYFGTFVNNSVAINDELNWIYRILQFQKGKTIEGKKIVRKMREQYGMVRLLNFVMESVDGKGANSSMGKFIDYIRQNKLLAQQKLQKYVTQKPTQQSSNRQPNNPQPNNTQTQPESQLPQKTISSISIPSQIQRMGTQNPQQQQESDPYKSMTLVNNRETWKETRKLHTKSLIKEKKELQKQGEGDIDGETKLQKRRSQERRDSQDNRSSLVQLYPINISN